MSNTNHHYAVAGLLTQTSYIREKLKGVTGNDDTLTKLKDLEASLLTLAAALVGVQMYSPNKLTDGERAHLRVGNKIGAIKCYRERTGVGLKEAKDAIEAIARKEGYCGVDGRLYGTPDRPCNGYAY
jgi:hypothetical protein